MARLFSTKSITSQENNWQGDDISGTKDPDKIRMMFHNVNGINLYGHTGLDMFVNEQATQYSPY